MKVAGASASSRFSPPPTTAIPASSSSSIVRRNASAPHASAPQSNTWFVATVTSSNPESVSASITSGGELRLMWSKHPSGSAMSWMLPSTDPSVRSAEARYSPTGPRSAAPQSPVARICVSEQRDCRMSPVAITVTGSGSGAECSAASAAAAVRPSPVSATSVTASTNGHSPGSPRPRTRSIPPTEIAVTAGPTSSIGTNAHAPEPIVIAASSSSYVANVSAGAAGANAAIAPFPSPGATAKARTGPAMPPTSAQSVIAPRARSSSCVRVSASTPAPIAATGT